MTIKVADTTRAHRELIVNEHIEAEAVRHDVAATVKAFRHPRYEVPALALTSRDLRGLAAKPDQAPVNAGGEQCAPKLVKVLHGLMTANLRSPTLTE